MPAPTAAPGVPLTPAPSSHEARRAAQCDVWYGAYGTGVYRFLRFHTDSADTAEDLAAETFMRVFEAMDRFDPARAEARVWIFGIARNVLRDHFRRAKVRNHVSIGATRDLAADAPSPEERLLREEQQAKLLDGVRQLGERDRELIGLRYGSELSMAEIGDVLGVRESAVRTRLWRALERLRSVLGAEP